MVRERDSTLHLAELPSGASGARFTCTQQQEPWRRLPIQSDEVGAQTLWDFGHLSDVPQLIDDDISTTHQDLCLHHHPPPIAASKNLADI